MAMTRHINKVLLAILAALVAVIVLVFSPLTTGTALAQRLPGSQAEIDLTFSPLVKQSAPAVVNVYTRKVVRQAASPFASDPAFRRFLGDDAFGMSRERVQSSLGSGVLVGSDGVIVTNNHVVKDADELTVVLSDRREFEAELVLADDRTDLAVLKIDPEGEVLPTLEYADTRAIEVGDLVLAIGNPFGVGQTVTSGIVSATARTDVGVSDYAFFIQTDAAINPGNSGGALVDTRGRLVGVNTAIFSRSGGSNGIGFAIPAEMVRRFVDSAINEGRVVRPWLGLKGQAVTSDIARSLGLDRPQGVLVSEVYPDGPAEQAGLRLGDIVQAIDDREVFNERGLRFLAATYGPGDEVRLNVLRKGEVRRIDITLALPPGTTDAELTYLEGRHPLSGAEVADLSPALAEALGRDLFDSGVFVNRLARRSVAARFGVRPGDIILEINGEIIRDVASLEGVLREGTRNGVWRVAIDRNGRRISASARF